MRHFKPMLITLAMGAGGFPASGAFARCADLALVLAIDGSGSIDAREFNLQQLGYAAAFLDPRVQSALAEAGVVDVAVVLWGDGEMATQVQPWHRVASVADAARLGAGLADIPRQVTGNTGIGSGLSAALDLIENDATCATRRIINVSGDGKESVGPGHRTYLPVTEARARAGAMGITVNGLAISEGGSEVADYYRDKVITGPDAFVMSVATFEAFGEAIIRKLAREIALPKVAAIDATAKAGP